MNDSIMYSNDMKFLPTGGTLIVACMTGEGLLVVADKRTYDVVRGDRDDVVKLQVIGSHTVIATTGLPTFLDSKSFATLWDAETIVASYYQSRAVTIPGSFGGVAESLAESFKSFLARGPFTGWPVSGNPPDSCLFQVAFYHYDTSSSNFKISYLRFNYKKENPPWVEIRHNFESDSIFEQTLPTAIGNIAVYQELKSGKDPRFDDLRNDGELMGFLFNKTKTMYSLDKARELARRFVVITSEKTSLIENSTFHVGPTVDMLLISANGVRRIE